MSTPPTPIFYDKAQVCLVDSGPITAPGLDRVQFAISTIPCVVIALLFGFLIFWRYNHVLVIHRRIHTTAVSNTIWIIFFVAVGFEDSLRLARIITGSPETTLDVCLFYGQRFARGCASVLLCLALDYQRRHRSSAPPVLPAGFAVPQGVGLPLNSGIQETKVLLSKPGGDTFVANRNATFLSCTGLIALQSVLYCTLLVTEIVVLERTDSDLPDEVYKWMFRSSIWGMQLTVLVLAVIIVCNEDEDGPMLRGKVLLSIATILSVGCHAMPNQEWQAIFPAGCAYSCLAWSDTLDVLMMVSHITYFLFMREEYKRNKETCIYSTVSQIQHAQIHNTWQSRHYQ